jgi:hypothetical protein
VVRGAVVDEWMSTPSGALRDAKNVERVPQEVGRGCGIAGIDTLARLKRCSGTTRVITRAA